MVYSYFLIDTWIPLPKLQEARKILRNDQDFVSSSRDIPAKTIHVFSVQVHIATVADHEQSQPPTECNLEEMLKPPAERKTVKELRDNQRIGHFTRQMIYHRTKKEWRSIPKSYPIAPPRE